MALDNIGLGRLLGILPRPLNQRLAIIRSDARKAVLKERKLSTGDGPDFYVPFWSDAKEFFFGRLNLREAVKERIGANRCRRRLYSILLDQFLSWHRETAPDGLPRKKPIEDAFGSCTKLAEKASVKVYGVLGWMDEAGEAHIVYPYFSKDLALTPKVARLGRWAMSNAITAHDVKNMTVLDVLRARAYDNDNCVLVGDEEEVIAERYNQFLSEWEVQKRIFRRR